MESSQCLTDTDHPSSWDQFQLHLLIFSLIFKRLIYDFTYECFAYMYVYIHSPVCVYLYACAYWGQKKVPELLGELELQVVLSHPTRVLGIKLGPPGRAGTMSLAPSCYFLSLLKDLTCLSVPKLSSLSPGPGTGRTTDPTLGPSKDENTIPVPFHTWLIRSFIVCHMTAAH